MLRVPVATWLQTRPCFDKLSMDVSVLTALRQAQGEQKVNVVGRLHLTTLDVTPPHIICLSALIKKLLRKVHHFL